MGIPATAEDTTSRARIDMIGVPFDGMGRSPGQAGAPEALRAAGLPAAFGPDAVMEPDLVLPGPVAQRAAGSGLLNERALLQMIDALYRRVRSSLSAGRFPFVYGADCSVLLAAVPALRDIAGRAGLVFVDGHEDATPMDLSSSGEAANMEIALLLGLTGEQAPRPLRDRLPALDLGAIAMLGPRDQLFRQAANVPTVADRVWLRSADEVSADPADCARPGCQAGRGARVSLVATCRSRCPGAKRIRCVWRSRRGHAGRRADLAAAHRYRSVGDARRRLRRLEPVDL